MLVSSTFCWCARKIEVLSDHKGVVVGCFVSFVKIVLGAAVYFHVAIKFFFMYFFSVTLIGLHANLIRSSS